MVKRYWLVNTSYFDIGYGQRQHFDLDLWPCDLNIYWGNLLSRGIHCTKFNNFQAKGSRDSKNDFYKDQQFDLDLWPCDLNINRVIYSLVTSTVPSLETFEQRGQEILSGHHFYEEQKFDLDLWLCDLWVNREHLLPRGIHCTKFGNFQAKNLKEIEWTSLGLQTNRSWC